MHDALAAVVQRGVEHLVPYLLDVRDPRTLDEPRQVLFNNPAAQLAAGCDREADGAVARLDLDHQGAEHVEAEALPALAVVLVLAHRRGDVVVDPVPSGLVVVVGTAPTEGKGTNVFDGGHAHGHILRRSSSIQAGQHHADDRDQDGADEGGEPEHIQAGEWPAE